MLIHHASCGETSGHLLASVRIIAKYSRQKAIVPVKRGVIGKMEKKMTSGIVSLTRPRFGKRSVADDGEEADGEAYDDLLAAELMSPLTKAIYVYLVKNYGTPINNKPTRGSTKLFSNLTRPRYGKRSLHGPGAVLKIIQVFTDCILSFI